MPDGAQVTRYAPSPTGFMHLGNFFQAFISSTVARMSNGIFYLRNEDTDKKREVEGASAVIMGILFDYGIMPAEYELKGGVTVGNYGPYYQSERVEIYKAYAKKLVSEGKAFPCFCDKASGIGEIKEQREKKFAVGLSNDDKDPCRNLTFEQIEKFVKEGKKFAIRLKSNGNSKNKVEFFDVLKGKISMEENSKDVVILKSDGLPPYHFAGYSLLPGHICPPGDNIFPDGPPGRQSSIPPRPLFRRYPFSPLCPAWRWRGSGSQL